MPEIDNSKNEQKVMWFSRHQMTEDQKAALGPNVTIEQVDKSIKSVAEVKDEVARNDIIAIVAPVNLQQQFLKEAGDKPVIMAVSDRVLVPQGEGKEDAVEFRFNKWEQLDAINVLKHDYEPEKRETEEPQKVLWVSRHPMTLEQEAALGPNVEVDQVNATLNSAYDIKDMIDSHEVIAIVAPINLQQQFLSIAKDKPVIMAVSDRVLIPQPDGTESKVEFVFNKWEQLDRIDIQKHDYEPELPGKEQPVPREEKFAAYGIRTDLYSNRQLAQLEGIIDAKVPEETVKDVAEEMKGNPEMTSERIENMCRLALIEENGLTEEEMNEITQDIEKGLSEEEIDTKVEEYEKE